ncbi:HutD/Ves family protein [Rahnella woolbedingensis]|uniref:HutD family protein n=1 Tax=Rahnella woolbedingensis TaxID=1510574 RepID=A0A419N934_9GAMM|nr:HutD family protein [Rahnella woolbedingensis]RJT44023.1 HutD family protein [Rahnella woolbedingensis]
MTDRRHFTFAGLPVSPWRNGGGETREIISYPPGKSDFDWRISIATIAQDGPFSAFGSIDRSITLLSGEGVHLQALPDIDHTLDTCGVPFSFSGDIALSARLLGGVTTDFNVMTRRTVCAARVMTTGETLRISPEKGGVIYVIRGEWQLPDGTVIGAGEGIVWSDCAPYDPDFSVAGKHSDGLLLWAAITE